MNTWAPAGPMSERLQKRIQAHVSLFTVEQHKLVLTILEYIHYGRRQVVAPPVDGLAMNDVSHLYAMVEEEIIEDLQALYEKNSEKWQWDPETPRTALSAAIGREGHPDAFEYHNLWSDLTGIRTTRKSFWNINLEFMRQARAEQSSFLHAP